MSLLELNVSILPVVSNACILYMLYAKFEFTFLSGCVIGALS